MTKHTGIEMSDYERDKVAYDEKLCAWNDNGRVGNPPPRPIPPHTPGFLPSPCFGCKGTGRIAHEGVLMSEPCPTCSDGIGDDEMLEEMLREYARAPRAAARKAITDYIRERIVDERQAEAERWLKTQNALRSENIELDEKRRAWRDAAKRAAPQHSLTPDLLQAASDLLCVVQNGERNEGELYAVGCKLERILRSIASGSPTEESQAND